MKPKRKNVRENTVRIRERRLIYTYVDHPFGGGSITLMENRSYRSECYSICREWTQFITRGLGAKNGDKILIRVSIQTKQLKPKRNTKGVR